MIQSLQLSIVVPMYNAAPYLEDCVNALLDQDLQAAQYEIILVNDGSTDQTLRIAEQLSQGRSNIKVISQANRGQAAARNAGFDRATGEFVWFVDSDDVIARDCLAALLQLLGSQQLDIITFEILRVPDRAALSDFVFLPGKALGIVSSGVQYIADHNYNNGPWSYVVRSGFLRKTNLRFIEGRWCEDGMFSLPLIYAAQRVAKLPVAVYGYVLNPNSNMSSKTEAHQRKMIAGFVYAVDYFDRFIMDISQAAKNVPRFMKRIVCRRDSYVFFLLIRLLKARLGYDYTKAVYRELVAKGRVPLREFCGEDYPGPKYKLLSMFISTPWLFLAACWIVNVLRLRTMNR